MATKTKTWLTRKQAAVHGSVSTRTVDRLLAAGKLTRHRRPGTRNVLIDPDELTLALEPAPQRSVS